MSTFQIQIDFDKKSQDSKSSPPLLLLSDWVGRHIFVTFSSIRLSLSLSRTILNSNFKATVDIVDQKTGKKERERTRILHIRTKKREGPA